MAGGSARALSRSTGSSRCGSCPDRAGPHRLVVNGLRASYSRQPGQLRGFRRARRSGPGLTTVVTFLLVPQGKLSKRLDVARAAERWAEQLPALIEQQLKVE